MLIVFNKILKNTMLFLSQWKICNSRIKTIKFIRFERRGWESMFKGWISRLWLLVIRSRLIISKMWPKSYPRKYCLIRSLGNEVGRRLDSFSETVAFSERVSALDRFSQKLLNSGHSLGTVRNILVSGIKGFKRKVARCQAGRVPLHRSASQSAASRRTKKSQTGLGVARRRLRQERRGQASRERCEQEGVASQRAARRGPA